MSKACTIRMDDSICSTIEAVWPSILCARVPTLLLAQIWNPTMQSTKGTIAKRTPARRGALTKLVTIA